MRLKSPFADLFELTVTMDRDALLHQLLPKVNDIGSLRGLHVPERVPPGVDLARNVREAERMDPWEFKAAVRNGGRWDYKQLGKEYQEFGNWHYGLVSRALRWLPSQETALRAAGWAQSEAGTWRKEWGVWYANAPYGDDPMDQEWIKAGWEIWDAIDRRTDPRPLLLRTRSYRLDPAESDISDQADLP